MRMVIVMLLLLLLLLFSHLEGQQLFRMKRIERAQVRNFAQQFQEESSLVGVGLIQHILQDGTQFRLHPLYQFDISQSRSIGGDDHNGAKKAQFSIVECQAVESLGKLEHGIH